MRLISLYIENFGGLSRYELNFEPGLTMINQPNGFGKTTLAEFIRAMFYGFPRKVRTLEKSRRQKYAPWNSGTFGGNLAFEHEGQRYRIERTFGAVPKGDTFTLIDLATNKKSACFSEEIGVELFGLDSDSFERSTYLPQLHEDGPLSTAAIQAKLSALVEDGTDMTNFDKAIAALRTKRSALIPYRGSGGAVAEASGKIAELQMQLDFAEMQHERFLSLQQESARTEAELEHIQAELAALRQKLTDASEAAAAAVRHRQYEQLQQRYRLVSAKAADLKKIYPVGFPDGQSLRSAEAAADRLAVLQSQVITTPADQHAQGILEENASFEAQLPTEEQMERCRRKCEAYDALQERIRNMQQKIAEKLHRPVGAPHIGIPIAVLVLGIAAVVAGAALMFLQMFLYGTIALGIGLAVLLAAVLLLRTRKKKLHTQEQNEAEQQELAALRHDAVRCRAEIGGFLSPYFGAVEPQHFLACLTRLEHNREIYAQAQRQVADWQTRKAQHTAVLKACSEELEEFFTRFGMPMGEDARAQLRQLRDDLRDARALLAQKQELSDQLCEFQQEHTQALARPIASEMDMQKLKSEEQTLRSGLTALTEKLLRQKQELQELRTQADRIPQLREELARWQQQKEEGRENAHILDDTMDFLQQARERLSTSYLGTIQTHFGYYLSKLEGMPCEKFLIDTDLQVQLERLGQTRDLAYFSAGQTDLVMLCMRLALVDALFKEQETFVILDDPFVNLDDAHTAQALELLRILSNHRQILYLTCHSSRTLQVKRN